MSGKNLLRLNSHSCFECPQEKHQETKIRREPPTFGWKLFSYQRKKKKSVPKSGETLLPETL